MEEYLKMYAETKKKAVDEAIAVFQKLIEKNDLDFVYEVINILNELIDVAYDEAEFEEEEEEEDDPF